MLRPYRLLPLLTISCCALCGSAALGDNIFNLQVNPASADPTALKVGDVLKLDVLFTSDSTTLVRRYQTAIAFDSAIFDPKTSSDASIYTKNPSSVFTLQAPNGVGTVNGLRVFTGSESRTTTTTFPSTPTLLGTFNLTVLNSAPSGTTNIAFTDLLSPVPPANLSNFLGSTGSTTLKPTFQNGVVTVRVAAVPEPGTLLSLGSLLVIGGLVLRRNRQSC